MLDDGIVLVCCFCHCKDTNFKANHNLRLIVKASKVCCFCHCKDTNFKANHNYAADVVALHLVVSATAKILILKQITTLRVEEDSGGIGLNVVGHKKLSLRYTTQR